MSFESLKVVGAELVTTWRQKFNTLVQKTFFNVNLVNGKTLRFYRSDGDNVDIELPNLGSGGGGVAENTEYNSNFFILNGDSYHNSLQKIDAILGALSPVPAGMLTGQTLGYNNDLVFYPAKLPSGLAAAWYPSGVVAGATINQYTIGGTYTFYTPSNTFRVGKVNDPIGKVVHVVNGQDVAQAAVTTGATSITVNGTNGTSVLSVSSQPFNTIWQRGSASVSYKQVAEGYLKHSIKHVDENNLPISGETTGFGVWYDNLNVQPGFRGAPTHTATPQIKYLSGIQYYGQNTVINLSYIGVSLFKNGYHPTAVSIVTSPYFAQQVVNPASVPASDSDFAATIGVTLSNANQSSGLQNGTLVINLYRPTGATASVTYMLDKRVCTFGTVSTPTVESFVDEARRLVNDTTTAFVSNSALISGHSQVANGNLVYPLAVDYTGRTGEQEYQRYFTKVAASNGMIIFNGISYSSISPYGSGDLNVLLLLEGSNKFFDVGIPFGAGGNGSTRATAIGCKRSDVSSGSTVGFSFGLESTANPGNNDKYRLIVLFRDTNGAKNMGITSIVTS